MKILITNTVVANGGDSAILQGVMRIIKSAFGEGTEFVIYDNQPEVVARYYKELSFRKLIYFNIYDSIKKFKICKNVIARLLTFRFLVATWLYSKKLTNVSKFLLSSGQYEAIKDYSSCDLVVSTGGTYLVDNYEIFPRILEFKVALLLNKPLALFTQSMGPFKRFSSKKDLSFVFKKAICVFLRDKESLQNLKEICDNEANALIFPDAVFSLIPPNTLQTKKYFHSSERKLKVVVSVRDWPYFKTIDNSAGMANYVRAMRQMVSELIGRYDGEVLFVSTCQGVEDYWYDDSMIAEEVLHGLPPAAQKFVIIDRNFHTPTDLFSILEQADAVIATRMHMAILSLVAHRPVLSIAYEFKTRQLFQKLGLEKWCMDIEGLHHSNVVDRLHDFVSNLHSLNQDLKGIVEKERLEAFKSGESLRSAYEGWCIRNQPS